MKDYYLSRIDLNARKRGARKLLSSPQAMHAAVESSLPASARDAGRRFLWRVDSNGLRHDLYVLSPASPDFSHLIEQAGWQRNGTADWVTKSYDPMLAQLDSGQLWAFRLAANPTHIGRTSDGKKKRFAHVTAAQQVDWLLSRATSNGFSIPIEPASGPAVEVVERADLHFARGHQQQRVTLRKAVFEGVLQVQDPTLLSRALVEGIGRAKAYGCGLLTLAPLSLSSPVA